MDAHLFVSVHPYTTIHTLSMNIGIIIVAIIICVVAIIILKNIKRLKPSNVYFISGAVKTGKTYVTVALAIKQYKKHLRQYYVKKVLLNMLYFLSFKKLDCRENNEKPMLYSNIKLRYIKFNPFTSDILLRKVRIPYKSIVLLDETSLIADSMLYKDKDINDNLLLFYKLFGHYSKGGYCFANSQCVSDNHYALKRAMGRYLYVYNRTKFPFLTMIKGVELINSEDNQNVTNMVVGDTEKNIVPLLFSNKYYQYYDCYCYSIFTDSLTIQVDYDKPILKKRDSLKSDTIVTLQDFKNLDKRFTDKGEEKK